MRKGFIEVRLNCVHCCYHVLGGVDYHVYGVCRGDEEKNEDNSDDGDVNLWR